MDGDLVATIHTDLTLTVQLIHHRLLEGRRSVRCRELQVAIRINRQPGAGNLPANPGWVRAWGDHKVVLQLALVAVEDQVDAGIDSGGLYLAVGGDVRVPLGGIVPHKVVHDAGLTVEPSEIYLRIRSCQGHAQSVGPRILLLPLQAQDDFLRGEEERVA